MVVYTKLSHKRLPRDDQFAASGGGNAEAQMTLKPQSQQKQM
jgi:hypothetical protein